MNAILKMMYRIALTDKRKNFFREELNDWLYVLKNNAFPEGWKKGVF